LEDGVALEEPRPALGGGDVRVYPPARAYESHAPTLAPSVHEPSRFEDSR